MAVTGGFYNSLDGDRKYDAIQVSSIFDGIITDGIFMHYLDRFITTTSEIDPFTVNVATGRGWFDHSWILNDAILPLRLPISEVLTDRIDAIMIDINGEIGVRSNSIIVVKGEPSTLPSPPTPIKSTEHNQYPIAHIFVRRGSTGVNQADITQRVGTGDTPYVTGPLTSINIEDMVMQWEDQWRIWEQEWIAYKNGQISEMNTTAQQWRDLWDSWYTETTTDALNDQNAWQNDRQSRFDTWFASLQDELEPDVAATLAASIVELRSRVGVLETDMATIRNGARIKSNMLDSNNDTILDNFGNAIFGIAKFVVEEIA